MLVLNCLVNQIKFSTSVYGRLEHKMILQHTLWKIIIKIMWGKSKQSLPRNEKKTWRMSNGSDSSSSVLIELQQTANNIWKDF